jgi:hypothetical protein
MMRPSKGAEMTRRSHNDAANFSGNTSSGSPALHKHRDAQQSGGKVRKNQGAAASNADKLDGIGVSSLPASAESTSSSLHLSSYSGHVQLSDLSEADKLKVAKLVQHLIALGADNDNLRKELEATKAASQISMSHKIAESAGMAGVLKAELERKVSEVNDLQTKRLSALDLLARYQQKISELIDEVRSLSRANQDGRLAIERMTQENRSMQMLLESQNQSIVTLREQIASGNNSYRNGSSVVAERLADVEDQLLRRTDALQREESKSQRLEKTVMQLQEQLSAMRLIVQEKDTCIAKLNESVLVMSKENSLAVAARVEASLNRSIATQSSENQLISSHTAYQDQYRVTTATKVSDIPVSIDPVPQTRSYSAFSTSRSGDYHLSNEAHNSLEGPRLTLMPHEPDEKLCAPPLVAPVPPLMKGSVSPPRLHGSESPSPSSSPAFRASQSDVKQHGQTAQNRQNLPLRLELETSNDADRPGILSSVDISSSISHQDEGRWSQDSYDRNRLPIIKSALDALEEPEDEIELKRSNSSTLRPVSNENKAPQAPRARSLAGSRPVSSSAATALTSSLSKNNRKSLTEQTNSKRIRFVSTKSVANAGNPSKKNSAADKRPKARESSSEEALSPSPRGSALSRVVFPESPGGALVREVLEGLDSGKSAMYDPMLFDLLDEMDSTDSTISTIPRLDPLRWH